MQAGAQGLVPAPNLAQRLQRALDCADHHKYPLDDIEWSLSESAPLLDSANIVPEGWERLANLCLEHKQADGIIVIHGTDTLAYTSSALVFLLQNIGIPVIVTGAQKPLEAPGSDALNNLTGAMLETRHAGPGVWVYFDHHLMHGARVVKKDALGFAGFDAPRLTATHNNSAIIRINAQPKQRNWATINIACVHMVPGFQASNLHALTANQPDAIILALYGLGTLADKNKALLEALHHAQNQGIIVVAISQCYIGSIDFSVYATGAQLSRLGILSGRDLTLEAAYAKLMVLFRLGYPAQKIRTLFENSICHEMSDHEK